jgi:D-aminopeptidase
MQFLRESAGVALACLLCGPGFLLAQSNSGNRAAELRARDVGIPFDGTPGPLNAITDVVGVEVGYKTLISGEGQLIVGKGPVRTGVTAILPRGKSGDPIDFTVVPRIARTHST